MSMTKEVKKIILISCAVAIGFFLIGYIVSSQAGNLSAINSQPANQTTAPDTELPDIYPCATAISNGDYVNVHGEIYNDDVMTDFINKVAEDENALIRTVLYTVEGDPIIIDFSYNPNNSKCFSVTKDTTRDRYGDGETTNRRFDNLVIYEDVDPDRYVDGKRTYYIVTDLLEITKEIFVDGFEHEVLKYDQ